MSTAWYVVKRIAHALGWLIILSPAYLTLAALIVGVVSLVAGWPGGFPAGFLLRVAGEAGAAPALVVAVSYLLLLPVSAYIWMLAVRQRWSLTWPLIIIAVVFWPFGLTWVAIIGLGKLIVHAVGRGSTVAGSYLDEPVAEARPRGLVEYACYD